MDNTKTLALAALAALSLGIGSAMAQSEVPGGATIDYWGAKVVATHQASAPISKKVQAGSSDIGTAKSGIGHFLPFNGDYGDLANPG